MGPYKLFGWDFRHRLKLTFLNSCSPFRVWIWIRKKNNLKLFFYYRKEWLNKLVHLVRLYYIWGYGSGRNQSFNVQRSRLKSQTGCSQKSNTWLITSEYFIDLYSFPLATVQNGKLIQRRVLWSKEYETFIGSRLVKR